MNHTELDYTDHLYIAVKDLIQAAYKDVDTAIDEALKLRGAFGTNLKERLSVYCTEQTTVYMLDNKPLVTVSKPLLRTEGTNYRVCFRIERH